MKRPTRPLELRILCGLMLFWSALSIVPTYQQWPGLGVLNFGTDEHETKIHFSLGLFACIAALGLWYYRPFGRTLALLYTWCWLFCGVLLVVQLFPIKAFKLTGPNTDLLAAVPHGVLRVAIFPFVALQSWQLWILKRPAFRSLFVSSPPLPKLPGQTKI